MCTLKLNNLIDTRCNSTIDWQYSIVFRSHFPLTKTPLSFIPRCFFFFIRFAIITNALRAFIFIGLAAIGDDSASHSIFTFLIMSLALLGDSMPHFLFCLANRLITHRAKSEAQNNKQESQDQPLSDCDVKVNNPKPLTACSTDSEQAQDPQTLSLSASQDISEHHGISSSGYQDPQDQSNVFVIACSCHGSSIVATGDFFAARGQNKLTNLVRVCKKLGIVCIDLAADAMRFSAKTAYLIRLKIVSASICIFACCRKCCPVFSDSFVFFFFFCCVALSLSRCRCCFLSL